VPDDRDRSARAEEAIVKALCQEQRGPGLRIAPLIDVVFLLLIFFLVATTFYEEEKDITIKLAQATGGEERVESTRIVVVNVKKSGVIVVNQRVRTMDQLGDLLKSVKEQSPAIVVVVRCDRHAYHKHFVRVLDLCESLEIGSVAVAIMRDE
jgi:biopolymer transport protein ExbD